LLPRRSGAARPFRHIDRLLQGNVPPSKIKVVINRFRRRARWRWSRSRKRSGSRLRLPFQCFLDLIRAMNTGNPVRPERKSEFAIEMKKWAASLVPGQVADAANRNGGSHFGIEPA